MNQKPVVTYLLENGFDSVDAVDLVSLSPISIAKACGHTDLLDSLIVHSKTYKNQK